MGFGGIFYLWDFKGRIRHFFDLYIVRFGFSGLSVFGRVKHIKVFKVSMSSWLPHSAPCKASALDG